MSTGGSDGTCSTATTAGDWEQTAESNSEGGCKSLAGATVPGTPWPCVIHQTHLVLEMLCGDEEKQNMMGLGLFFPPLNPMAQHRAGLGLGTANLPILAVPGSLPHSHGQ